MSQRPITRTEVERRIDLAFEGEAMPRTERELAEPSIEAKYVIDHFFGRSRSDLDASTFLPSLHMEDFTYMTPEAVAYYLPAVLKLMLSEPHDIDLWIYLSGFLGSVRRGGCENLSRLHRAQHEASAAWAEFLSVAFDRFDFGRLRGDPKAAKRAAKLALLYRALAESGT